MRCPHCKKAPYPLFEGKPFKSKLIKKNLFRGSLEPIILFAFLMFLVFAYKQDIAKYDEVMDDPCGFCNRSNCCRMLEWNQFKEMQEQEKEMGELDGVFDEEKLSEIFGTLE